jgi:hypothetical protein
MWHKSSLLSRLARQGCAVICRRLSAGQHGVSTGSGSNRVPSTPRSRCRYEDPVATAPSTDLVIELSRHQRAPLNQYGFLLQFLRLIVSGESVDDLIERAVHDQVELVDRQTDAMICDAIFFEVIGADFF